MQHKPGRVGRILAVLFLAIAGPACAQILGNDFEVREGPAGGGDCSELDCAGCTDCAIAEDCSFEHDDCNLNGCEPFQDCCDFCGGDCNACDCPGRDQRFFALDSCITATCFGCGGSSVAVGGGA